VTGRALYLVNGSISSIRVLIALHEKGLAFEPRRLRVMREPRDTRTPAFLALNPRGQAPVGRNERADLVDNERLPRREREPTLARRLRHDLEQRRKEAAAPSQPQRACHRLGSATRLAS
jgi:hypothetical protein